jgi:hypothetical protein
MRERIGTIILTSALFILIGSIFLAGKPEVISAQDDGFKMYQLLVFCGDSSLASAIFGHVVTSGGTVGRPLMGTKSICVGNCGGSGSVSLDSGLAGLPASVSAGLRAKVDKHQADAAAGNGSRLTCLADDVKPPSEKKCDKPVPWFDGSSGCTDVQAPVVAINNGAATVSICGYPVFVGTPPTIDQDLIIASLERDKIRDFLQQRLGSRICCTKLREAARSGKPCYPAVDIDCDGKPNQADTITAGPMRYPDINAPFTKGAGPFDPFPPGLNPDDADFLPPQDKCDCKWELMKGTLNCSPDGKQNHFYQARWRCPSTGNERFTRKEAPPSAPCSKPGATSLLEVYTSSVALFEFSS